MVGTPLSVDPLVGTPLSVDPWWVMYSLLMVGTVLPAHGG